MPVRLDISFRRFTDHPVRRTLLERLLLHPASVARWSEPQRFTLEEVREEEIPALQRHLGCILRAALGETIVCVQMEHTPAPSRYVRTAQPKRLPACRWCGEAVPVGGEWGPYCSRGCEAEGEAMRAPCPACGTDRWGGSCPNAGCSARGRA